MQLDNRDMTVVIESVQGYETLHALIRRKVEALGARMDLDDRRRHVIQDLVGYFGPQAHNSIVSLDGRFAYLGTQTMLTVFDTRTDRVVRQIPDVGERGVFPYTVTSDNSTAFVCLGAHVGFLHARNRLHADRTRGVHRIHEARVVRRDADPEQLRRCGEPGAFVSRQCDRARELVGTRQHVTELPAPVAPLRGGDIGAANAIDD